MTSGPAARRSSGGTRRGGYRDRCQRRRALVWTVGFAVFASTVAALVVSVPSRADAQARPPGFGDDWECERHTGDLQLAAGDGGFTNVLVKNQNEIDIYSSGLAYDVCEKGIPWHDFSHGEQDPICDRGFAEAIADNPVAGRHVQVCPVDDDVEIIRARTDASVAFDPECGVLVSSEMREEHEWWVNELQVESENLTGVGCQVAATPPEGRRCVDINRDKDDLREQIRTVEENIDALQGRQGLGGEARAEMDRLTSLRQELNELEHVGGIIPDGCWGTYPNDHYTLTWHNGEDGLAHGARLMGWLAQILFAFSKAAITITLELIRQAFTFDVKEYRHSVARFAGRLDRGIVHLGGEDGGSTISLFDVAWFSLFAYAGFAALRGRMGKALAEILMSIGMAAFGWVLLTNTFGNMFAPGPTLSRGAEQHAPAYEDGGYFDSFADLLNLSAMGMLAVANDEGLDQVSTENFDQGQVETMLRDPREEDSEDAGALGRLHMEFVERPYMFLNYGKEDFTSQEEQGDPAEDLGYAQLTCEEAHEALLSIRDRSGPWTTRFLERHGCADEANWQGDMNAERLMGAALVTVVGFIVSLVLGLAAATLLLSKFVAALAFAALPLGFAAALAGGRARRPAFGLFALIPQLALAVLSMSAVLAFLVMGLDAINQTTTGDTSDGLFKRWVMILLVASTVFILRKRLVSASQRVASSVTERLSSTTGNTPSWAGAAGGGAVAAGTDGGVAGAADLMSMDRGVARLGFAGRSASVFAGTLGAQAVAGGARMGVHTAGGPYRMFRTRVAEYRTARKSGRRHWANLRSNALRNIHAAHDGERNEDFIKAGEDRDLVHEAVDGGHWGDHHYKAAGRLGITEDDISGPSLMLGPSSGFAGRGTAHPPPRDAHLRAMADRALDRVDRRARGERVDVVPREDGSGEYSHYELRERLRGRRFMRVMRDIPIYAPRGGHQAAWEDTVASAYRADEPT